MSATQTRVAWMALQAACLLACACEPKSMDRADADAAVAEADRKQLDNARERPGDLQPLPETSLLGKDGNGDHIRDDVADFIDTEYGSDERKRLMARQYARAVQHGLVYADEKDRAFEAAHESGRALACLHARLDGAAAAAIWKELQARTIDTEERLMAYARLQRTLSGGYFPGVRDPSAACAFDAEGLSP